MKKTFRRLMLMALLLQVKKNSIFTLLSVKEKLLEGGILH